MLFFLFLTLEKLTHTAFKLHLYITNKKCIYSFPCSGKCYITSLNTLSILWFEHLKGVFNSGLLVQCPPEFSSKPNDIHKSSILIADSVLWKRVIFPQWFNSFYFFGRGEVASVHLIPSPAACLSQYGIFINDLWKEQCTQGYMKQLTLQKTSQTLRVWREMVLLCTLSLHLTAPV